MGVPGVRGFGAIVPFEGGSVFEEEFPKYRCPADAEVSGGVSLEGGEVGTIAGVFVSRNDKGVFLKGSDEELDLLGSPVVQALGKGCDELGKIRDIVG